MKGGDLQNRPILNKKLGMLLGNYQSNFDNQKGRCAVPNNFRKILGKKAIITKGYESSLILIKIEDWQKIVDQISTGNFLSSMSRQTDRFLLGNAFEVEFDSQGRCVIPLKLRDYAKLEKEILFVGVGNRIEIWSKTVWEKNDQYLDENINQISQQLHDRQNDK